jgi:hypothetical protein
MTMINGEQMLWRSVIIQALKDAKDTKLSKKKRRKVWKWFCEENDDFDHVCFLANVDANAVKEKFIENEKVRK